MIRILFVINNSRIGGAETLLDASLLHARHNYVAFVLHLFVVDRFCKKIVDMQKNKFHRLK